MGKTIPENLHQQFRVDFDCLAVHIKKITIKKRPNTD